MYVQRFVQIDMTYDKSLVILIVASLGLGGEYLHNLMTLLLLHLARPAGYFQTGASRQSLTMLT